MLEWAVSQAPLTRQKIQRIPIVSTTPCGYWKQLTWSGVPLITVVSCTRCTSTASPLIPTRQDSCTSLSRTPIPSFYHQTLHGDPDPRAEGVPVLCGARKSADAVRNALGTSRAPVANTVVVLLLRVFLRASTTETTTTTGRNEHVDLPRLGLVRTRFVVYISTESLHQVYIGA